MIDKKTIPTRFLEAYNSFFEKYGFNQPDSIEIGYGSTEYDMLLEWKFRSWITKKMLKTIIDLEEVFDLVIFSEHIENSVFHSTVMRVFLKLDIPEIEKVDLKTQIKTIRKWIKKFVPTVSVRQNTGTAYGWIGIWGSSEGRDFTDEEREALKKLGFRPGGNYLSISPDNRFHWYTIAVDQLSME